MNHDNTNNPTSEVAGHGPDPGVLYDSLSLWDQAAPVPDDAAREWHAHRRRHGDESSVHPERYYLGWWPSPGAFAECLTAALGITHTIAALPAPWGDAIEINWDDVTAGITSDYTMIPDRTGGVHLFEQPEPDVIDQPDNMIVPLRHRTELDATEGGAA